MHAPLMALYKGRLVENGVCVAKQAIPEGTLGGASASVPDASEVEETLKRIRSHRGVEGILIVNNDGVALKSTLSAELTSQYASLFSQLASKARSVIRTLDATNDLTFLRVRSNKHEIMVAPDKDYMLIVIQNPSAEEAKV